MMWGDGGWNWIGGGLMMLILWGGLVALVVFLVRGRAGPSNGREERRPDPREILAERFARGEISEEEFEQRKGILERR